MSELPDDMKHALMHVAGVRLARNAFMALHVAGGTVWVEAAYRKQLWAPLKNGPRRLMGSTVQKLIDAGYCKCVADGSAMILEQTDKRP